MPKLNTKKRTTAITPDSFKIQMGTNLKELRIELGMTQTEFGEAIGVAYYQISRYERGKDEISLYLVLKICTVFDTSIERLLKGCHLE